MRKLLDSNLPVKYSLMGRLGSTDITTDGFYDAGPVRPCDKVMTLEELSKQPVNQKQPILVANTAAEGKSRDPKEEDKQQQQQQQRDEDESQVQLERATERRWTPPCDAAFQSLVTDATSSVLTLPDPREQCVALARLVSEAMGGPVEVERLHGFHWELHLGELKFRRRSNLVPVGSVRKGIYCHRALLFKCLADRVGLSCTLVRGEYNRAWNEVLLPAAVAVAAATAAPAEVMTTQSAGLLYVVDLMHRPGSLLRANTPAAIQYQSI
ncbi:hypothetical protein CRUP_017477 [Coryphaenoides rupestris]|nr:hypothetical protein CRUP_017477 [Coryphaenoides rupestris]